MLTLDPKKWQFESVSEMILDNGCRNVMGAFYSDRKLTAIALKKYKRLFLTHLNL